MNDSVLRQGFSLAHRHIGWIFLDVLWKLAWFLLTLIGFLLVGTWFGSEFNSIDWIDTGSRAINGAIVFGLVRQFWTAHRLEIFGAVGIVLVFSVFTWFALEAFFRARMFIVGKKIPFSTFFLSNILKSIFLATVALTFTAICFGRYLAAPISEWRQMWPDTSGAAFVAILTIVALGFVVAVADTLIRIDALELLGTDLFRVAGLIGVLVLFEAMLAASCMILIVAGLLNVSGLKSAFALLVTAAAGIGLLSVLHSYLLLVRYLAVGIMRHNVIEI